jgi:hypothetical protein
VEFLMRKAIMKTYLRLMSDRQTTVVTVPSLDFNSLHNERLQQLARFFRNAADRVVGRTVVLDVTGVKTAGAGFLTEIHRLSRALTEKHVQLVIVGELRGLFRLVGWHRRFRLYDSLVAAAFARAEWCGTDDRPTCDQHAPSSADTKNGMQSKPPPASRSNSRNGQSWLN